MNAVARRYAAWSAVAAVTALVGMMKPAADDQPPSQPQRVALPASASKPAPTAAGHLELERIKRQPTGAEKNAAAAGGAEAGAGEGVNLFSSTSWYVPPPPPKPEPPPKPVAPPLPFTFMGRYDETAKVIVMLVKGDRLYTVSVGDVIESTYRVDRITDRAIELIYLPLQERQTLSVGGA
jgi:hypothetical protein